MPKDPSDYARRLELPKPHNVLSLLIDDHGCSVRDAFIFKVNAVFPGHVPLGMKILKQRERNAAQRFRPIVVGESAVDAHTQNLGVAGLELVF